jgi:hypothetical protein
MGGEACGLGEGTHYGCECVMRRLAEAEARAAGLESALAVAGEEHAALTESRDAALRAIASEQARRETAERDLNAVGHALGICYCTDLGCYGAGPVEEMVRAVQEGLSARGEAIDATVRAEQAETSLSAALRRAEEAEAARVDWMGAARKMTERAVAAEKRAEEAESRAGRLAEDLRLETALVGGWMERTLAAESRSEALEKALRGLHDAVAGIVFREEDGRTFVASPPETIHRATFAMADAYDVLVPRALSVGVSRTGGEPGKEGNDGR